MLRVTLAQYSHWRADLCNLNATDALQGSNKRSVSSNLFLLQWLISNEENNCLWYMIHIERKLYPFVQGVSGYSCDQLYHCFPVLLASSIPVDSS